MIDVCTAALYVCLNHGNTGRVSSPQITETTAEDTTVPATVATALAAPPGDQDEDMSPPHSPPPPPPPTEPPTEEALAEGSPTQEVGLTNELLQELDTREMDVEDEEVGVKPVSGTATFTPPYTLLCN